MSLAMASLQTACLLAECNLKRVHTQIIRSAIAEPARCHHVQITDQDKRQGENREQP